MKKILAAAAAVVSLLTTTTLGAEIVMTDFSVSGDTVTVKGVIEDAQNSRASIYIENAGNGVYIGQAEADKDGAFDLSFKAPSSWTGSYTAHIGATDSEAQSVSFTYPEDKVYINNEYTPDEETAGESTSEIDVNAIRAVSRVTVSGTVKEPMTTDDKVMLVVKKAIATDMTESDVAYMDQTTLDEDGKFSFRFNFTGDLSEYVAYLYADGRNISDSIEIAQSKYEYISAEIELSQTYNRAVLLAKLLNEGKEDVPYMMIITMYDENNVMVGLKAEDAVIAGETSAEDTIDLVIPQEAIKVKAMLWNSREEMLPIADPKAMLPY